MKIQARPTKGKALARAESKEDLIKRQAEEAVANFEECYSDLQAMRLKFVRDFPKAHQAYQQILQQEDQVQEAIKYAHTLVQQARVTIGPFACVPKWSAAGYDGEAILEVLRHCEDRGVVLQELLDAGVLKELVLDRSATAFFASNPQYGELVKPAWRDRAEKTAAVTDPKI